MSFEGWEFFLGNSVLIINREKNGKSCEKVNPLMNRMGVEICANAIRVHCEIEKNHVKDTRML